MWSVRAYTKGGRSADALGRTYNEYIGYPVNENTVAESNFSKDVVSWEVRVTNVPIPGRLQGQPRTHNQDADVSVFAAGDTVTVIASTYKAATQRAMNFLGDVAALAEQWETWLKSPDARLAPHRPY